jgi:hypothetical protein
VGIFATQPIAGTEGSDRDHDLILQPLAPIELAFVLPEPGKKQLGSQAIDLIGPENVRPTANRPNRVYPCTSMYTRVRQSSHSAG